MKDGCAFCDYAGPSPVLYERTVITGNDVVGLESFPYFVIEPLDPVTPGHRLVIPREHSPDFRLNPRALGAMMQAASDQAAEVGANDVWAARRRGDEGPYPTGCNLIVSAGAMATQTVPHMHVHVVPRREGDGLALPWTPNEGLDLTTEQLGLAIDGVARLVQTKDAPASPLLRKMQVEYARRLRT